MYLAVKDVTVQDNYHLLLTFENDEQRVFDMKPYLDIGQFKRLKNPEVFNSVKVVFDTIEWENKADFDPEALYENSFQVE